MITSAIISTFKLFLASLVIPSLSLPTSGRGLDSASEDDIGFLQTIHITRIKRALNRRAGTGLLGVSQSAAVLVYRAPIRPRTNTRPRRRIPCITRGASALAKLPVTAVALAAGVSRPVAGIFETCRANAFLLPRVPLVIIRAVALFVMCAAVVRTTAAAAALRPANRTVDISIRVAFYLVFFAVAGRTFSRADIT